MRIPGATSQNCLNGISGGLGFGQLMRPFYPEFNIRSGSCGMIFRKPRGFVIACALPIQPASRGDIGTHMAINISGAAIRSPWSPQVNASGGHMF